MKDCTECEKYSYFYVTFDTITHYLNERCAYGLILVDGKPCGKCPKGLVDSVQFSDYTKDLSVDCAWK